LENSSGTTASADPDCYSTLLQQPSKRPSSPSSRSPHRRRANPPGLIFRGRVFHVRVAVPRKVQQTVGRTQVWRSLGTSNRSEAIRKAKLVIGDLERSFMAATGTTAHHSTNIEIALAKPVPVDTTSVHMMTFGELFRHFQADLNRSGFSGGSNS